MSEALRLAELLTNLKITVKGRDNAEAMEEAASELRRLHAELERKSDAIQRLWKERDELRSENRTLVRQNGEWQAINAELVEALRWYVDTDEVMEMEGNEFWLDGRERARAALAKWEASK